ncbi:unnamed protein product [Candidula unifasciata]|uniref:dCTP pyrophosphatase 1 n=1 Tax=Candidula unifasciata TaxID=100452 RepID=A0A8S3YRP8_9EUPU|nr:unnamed protein product [Candidula unifasciata]
MSQGEVGVTDIFSDKEEVVALNVVRDHHVAGAVIQKTNCEDNCPDVTKEGSFSFSDNLKSANLEHLRQLNEEFIKARNWDQFHSPRNVLLALVGEVGELAEIFQWKGEVSEGLPELSQAEREHVGQEVSDILIYLVDFASRCRIDLPKAMESKMAANALKYPVDKSYGKANKYTDFK